MEEEVFSSEDEENEGSEVEKTEEEITKKQRKRKSKPPGHRRNIKSKYDTIDDLNPEALSAQNEELERIRRLELQRSIVASEVSRDLSREESNQVENVPENRFAFKQM